MEKHVGLDPESLKIFFQGFLDQYNQEVEKNFSDFKRKLNLFNSMPVKIEMLMDKENRYCIVLMSKNKRHEFLVDNSFQDVLMVVAAANSKKYEYGEKNTFLYLFQVNAKRFMEWELQRFVRDFINYEMALK